MTGKTSTNAMPTGTTSGTPQVLLAHHLKQLKLPTVLREYNKVARKCAREGVDQAQQRRSARRHGKASQQASAGAGIGCQADALLRLCQASRASGARCQKRGDWETEGAPGTNGIEAPQTPDGEIEPDHSSEGG